MEYEATAIQIINLKNDDLVLRDQLLQAGMLGNGYNPEMEKVHNRNAKILDDIIDRIGYPTVNKVGKEASEAAWLIIQHAISQPTFMKRCALLLAQEVDTHNENPIHLAYLKDRIATFEGRPQMYGTSFDWDDDGTMSPVDYDNLEKVNERRKKLGLNTLEEQTVIMRQQAQSDGEYSPDDISARKVEYNAWRSKVGWV